ncbi:hypothetical protein [Vibrio owensii]|uniref:hypothetical protein n=1 Tax=Vibrio owensii TaxID=696485 RepID=UPI0018F126C8|nr:hypothetical protein [Vibrio owensii]
MKEFKKQDMRTKNIRRNREKERALSNRWRDHLTGSILEFIGEAGDYRRITLFHSAHLDLLIKKFRLEDGYVVTKPTDELDNYPKHQRSAIAANFLQEEESSLVESDGIASYFELLRE